MPKRKPDKTFVIKGAAGRVIFETLAMMIESEMVIHLPGEKPIKLKGKVCRAKKKK